MSGPGEPDPNRDTWRWRLAFGGLLALTMGVGPYVLHVLSALAPLITRDLGLSRTELGSLVTISFAVATLASVMSGDVSDRLGSRRMLFVMHGLTGIALVGLALGPTLMWLAAATALAGFSQASSNPVTNRLVARQVPSGRRGVLLGVKQSGVQMSQFFSGAVLPTVALALGWRGATAASVIFILVGIAATWILVPQDPQQLLSAPRTSMRTPAGPIVPWLAAIGFLTGVVMQGSNVYLPLYSFETLGFSPQLAGSVAGVVGALGVAGRIGWGRAAERLRTAVVPMMVISVISMLAMGSLLIATAGGPAWLWLGATLFSVSALSSTVVLMLAVVRSIPPESTGKASGQVMLGVYSGFMVGPVAFGGIVDLTDGYESGWAMLLGCSLAAFVVCLVWRRRASSGALEPQAGMA